MASLALGTLRVSKRLREAGFSEPQADAVTGILNDARETSLAELVTKSDLRETVGSLKSELKADIAELKSEFRAEITELKSELKLDIATIRAEVGTQRWILGVLVAGVATLILKAFFV